jgi:hypothetical protein
VRLGDALHRRDADAHSSRHGGGVPVGGLARRLGDGQRQVHFLPASSHFLPGSSRRKGTRHAWLQWPRPGLTLRPPAPDRRGAELIRERDRQERSAGPRLFLCLIGTVIGYRAVMGDKRKSAGPSEHSESVKPALKSALDWAPFRRSAEDGSPGGVRGFPALAFGIDLELGALLGRAVYPLT